MFFKRLAEPSTWAGLGILAGIFSANPLVPAAVAKLGAAVAAVVAVALPEKTS